jgi:hypothetical protein
MAKTYYVISTYVAYSYANLVCNKYHEILKKLVPIPRLVKISEIVDALLYLESVPMVNGENIRIDGGTHAGAKC